MMRKDNGGVRVGDGLLGLILTPFWAFYVATEILNRFESLELRFLIVAITADDVRNRKLG